MSDDLSKDINDVSKGIGVTGSVAGAMVTASGTSAASVAGAINSVGVTEAVVGAAEGVELVGAIGAAGEMTTYGAALVGGTTLAAGAVALAAGLYVGNEIEQHTHIGSESGDWMYEHSNPDDAYQSAQSFDQASEDFNQGNYLSAAGDVAEGFGHMVEGLWNGNPDDE
jgi:hypothetical protein